MKNLFCTILLVLSVFILNGQDYSDGIDDLFEIKFLTEDVARAIKLEWDHDSQEYQKAVLLYNSVDKRIEKSILLFESKIRSGKRIKDIDHKGEMKRIINSSETFITYYDENSNAGGLNSLFGFNLEKVFGWIENVYSFTENMISRIQESRKRKIENEVKKLHEVLDPARLTPWNQV